MINLCTLGTTRIDVGENRLYSTATLRFALLLYLSVEGRKPVPRAALTDLLLPDQSELKASHSLRELLYQLRQIGVEFTSTPEGIALPGDMIRSDVAELLRAESLDVEQVETAAADFLPGYAPQLSEAFAEWLDAFRERSVSELRKLVVRELRRARSAGEWDVIERMARACLRLDPYNEDATFAMAEVTALGGAKTEALSLLDRYIAAVGPRRNNLELPASMLKRRIAERLPQRYDARTVLPFVGRDAELAEVVAQFARASGGDASCVVLIGDAGIGKTRLANEFVARAALDGARFVTATAQPHDIHRPMGAFVDLVPQLLELPGALGCSPASMSALKRLTTHDPLAAAIPLQAVQQSDEVAAAISRAISDLVDAIASECVLVIWLEDAHWLDDMSMQVARHLAATRTNRRLLVLLTSRDSSDLPAAWGERPMTISINPLDESSVRALVDAALSGGAAAADQSARSDQSDRQWLVDTAAGNPFFLACLLSHIERTGERFAVPSTISELLDQRVAGLSSEARTALELCVFLGKYATIERIVAAIELPHFRLLSVLKELEERRMIAKSADLIRPSHWLIADSVQRKCAPIAAEFAHRCIAEMLEREASEGHSPGLLWDCGEHWLSSGNVARAVEVMRGCAKHSVDIGRPREAAESLQRAAEIASGDLRIELARESVRLAAVPSERDVVIRGLEILRDAGVPSAHDDIEIADLVIHSFIGSGTSDQIGRLRRCLEDTDSTPEHRLQLSLPLIAFCAQHGKQALAREAFELLTPLLQPSGDPTTLHALQFLLIYHTSFGDIDEADRLARQMLRRTDWPVEQQADACRKAGIALWRCGKLEEAIDAFTNGCALAESTGLARLDFVTALMASSLSSDLGDTRGYRAWLDRAEKIGDRIPSLRANFEYLILRTDIASATCDLTVLSGLYSKGIELGIPDDNERIQRWSRTLKALIEHLSGAYIDYASTIEQLTRYVSHGDDGATGDFEMATALMLSRVSESSRTTRRRLHVYQSRQRRGRTPLSAMLQQVIAEINNPIYARRPRTMRFRSP
jgi:DNA-binding SARP family transcriptional activator